MRSDIWTKLWGNLAFNPISALTRATLEDICRFAPTRALAAEMMREAQTVGEAFGVRFRISIEKRIAGAEGVGAHKTSMLQDVEQSRAMRRKRAWARSSSLVDWPILRRRTSTRSMRSRSYWESC